MEQCAENISLFLKSEEKKQEEKQNSERARVDLERERMELDREKMREKMKLEQRKLDMEEKRMEVERLKFVAMQAQAVVQRPPRRPEDGQGDGTAAVVLGSGGALHSSPKQKRSKIT